MADGKLDLPDDLLSSTLSDQSPWITKVEASGGIDEEKVFMGSIDDSKDQMAAESSIPLSPQWLYSKPNDAKTELRAPNSFSTGNSTDFNLKEGWRLDGSADKKDKKTAPETDSTRRWREEERETSLLSGRRDRRKTDRRTDNLSVREPIESRPLPPSDRWTDSSNRNSALEPRRDSKWSTRWGPDDKERDSRTEKRTEVEKDDVQKDNQTAIVNNRTVSERDSDSRDKWRPRHRMEVNSTGPASYRAAPGFGLEKGMIKGSTTGFIVGRGRAIYGGRDSSGGPIGAVQFDKNESVPGKPSVLAGTFCYPRGKLLDIYRKQKIDSSLSSMPDYLDKLPSITQSDTLEPLAFVVPDAEEEVILNDIEKGKINSSEVAYSSIRKVQYENVSDTDHIESSEGKNHIVAPVISDKSIDTGRGAASHDAYQVDVRTLSTGGNSKHEKGEVLESDSLSPKIPAIDKIFSNTEISGSRHTTAQITVDENGPLTCYAFTKHPQFDEIESAAFLDRSTKLSNDSDSQFLFPSTEQVLRSNQQKLEINNGINQQEVDTTFEELSLYYLDPQGELQGPFLGVDIISWLEQRFFGIDLPVRFADAPEGTPFQELGHVLSYLRVRDGFASGIDPSPTIDEFAVLGHSEARLSDSSMFNNLSLPSSELDKVHVHSRTPENGGLPPLPHSEGQHFRDAPLDEDIVFPGRPGSGGYHTGNYSRSVHDPLSNSISHHALLHDLAEPVMPNQNDNELHPFGLLRSELEAAGHAQSSNMPSGIRRAAGSFGAMEDQTRITDTWPEVYKEHTLSNPGIHQDALGARHAALLEQDPSHFDLAERLMSQQVQQQLLQQQLQQRNLLNSHLHLNEPFLDHVPSWNHVPHQQLANHHVHDLEHLYMLQLQEQRQHQLKEQRQLQLLEQRQLQLQEQRQLQLQEQRQLQLQQHQLQQQQQFHQQKQLLQDQQQSQARQVLLEQLLHNQMHDSVLGQTRGDPGRTNKALDQNLLKQQFVHDLQQHSHHPPRHGDSSLDQLVQAKFDSPQHQNDLYELMSRAQHEQLRSLAHQMCQQEQLQARQLPLGLRQRMDMEEERNIRAAWPIGEANQFFRTNPTTHQVAGNPLDLYQLQQRMAHEEQLERSLSLQDRIQLERSISLPHGVNRDAVHAFDHASQMNSGLHSHQSPPLPNQFHVSHLDGIEGHWSDSNGRLGNDWTDSQIQQSQLNAERQKREAQGKLVTEDPSLWMSESINDEKSKRLLMQLLHQKSGHQTDALNSNNEVSFERRVPSNQSFSSLPDQEVGLNHLYPVGSSGFNLGGQPHTYISNEQTISLHHSEMLQRSKSGVMIEEEPLNARRTSSNTNKFSKSSMERELTEVEGKRYGFKSEGITKLPTVDVQEGMTEQLRFAAADHREISSNSYSKNASSAISGVNSGIFNDNGTQTDSVVGEIAKEGVPSLLSRAQDNILLRRPPVHRASASEEGLSDMSSDLAIRGKMLSNVGPLDGNAASQNSDNLPSSKKDMRFRRTSSYNDADVSETTSFIDMLKSNSKKSAPPSETATPSESVDGAQGKSGKKKGKKGRQIDPALLGFKVTSNRIMMGEIQRLED